MRSDANTATSSPDALRSPSPSSSASISSATQQRTTADSTATATETATSSQQLPDILGQLRLVPNRPHIQLPADDYPNPFQLLPTAGTSTSTGSVSSGAASAAASSSASTNNAGKHRHTVATAESSLREQLFGPRCCGCSAGARHKSHKSAEHTILHQKQFKQRLSASGGGGVSAVGSSNSNSSGGSACSTSNSSNGAGGNHDRRRIVLRQPQLRLLEQCLQHGLTQSCASIVDRPESPVQRLVAATTATASATAATTSTTQQTNHPPATTTKPQPARRSVQERLSRGFKNWNLLDNSFADFRSLVTGCENLSLSIGSVPDEHKSRAFRQLQQHQSHNHHHTHSRPPPSSRLKMGAARAPMKAPRSRSEDRLHSSTTLIAPTAAAAVSTCSQQAMLHQMTAASSSVAAAAAAASAAAASAAAASAATAGDCDVTIDELASYFETFVHIPKKMSSMAEMMYI